MTGYIFREAEERDIPRIAFIHIEAMRANPCNDIFSDYMSKISVEEYSKTWSEKFKKMRPLVRIFVLEYDGEVIGFGNVGPSGDDDVDDKTGSIYGLYLLPGLQGKGLGKALQRKMIDYLADNGFESVTAWIQENNYLTIKAFAGWDVDKKRQSVADGSDFAELRFHKIIKAKI